MSTDVDWQHELDSSFGTGHDLPPGHYVAAGRTAVRRRRAAAVRRRRRVGGRRGAAWARAPGGSPRSTPRRHPGPGPHEAARAAIRRRGRTGPSSSGIAGRSRDDALRGVHRQPRHPRRRTAWCSSPRAGPVLERVPNPMGYDPAQGRSLRAPGDDTRGEEQYSLAGGHPGRRASIDTERADRATSPAGSADGQSQQTLDVATAASTPACRHARRVAGPRPGRQHRVRARSSR